MSWEIGGSGLVGWTLTRPASAPTLLRMLAIGDACAPRVGFASTRLMGEVVVVGGGFEINIVRE